MHLQAHQAGQKDVKDKFADLLSPLLLTPSQSPQELRYSGSSPSHQKHQLSALQKTSKSRKQLFREEKAMNRGHWLLQENKKYHWFLEIHYKHFVNRQMRRMDRIFKSMQIFIGSRQAEQCRSHHQKMEKKFHRFSAIIQHLRFQHYATHEVQALMQDLRLNGHQFEDELASLQLLEAEELPLAGVQIKQRKKSSKKTSERVISQSIPKQQEAEEQQKVVVLQCKNEMINMLEESNNNIGELMLYHDRDENSGLLHFH